MKYTGSLFDVTIVAKIIVEWMTTLYKREELHNLQRDRDLE